MHLQCMTFYGLIILILCIILIPCSSADGGNDTFDAISQYNQGIDLANNGSYQEALHSLDNALLIAPNFTLAHIARAGVLSELGEYKKAIQAAEAAEALDPQNPSLLVIIANLYFLAGDYDSVLTLTNEAIQRDPEIPEAWIIRGSAYGALHHFKEEEEASLMALSLDPENEKAYENLNFARSSLLSIPSPTQTPKSELPLFSTFITIGIVSLIMYRTKI